MIKFLVPSRLSLCFQNEIELSFRKPESYKYHLHDYVKFDRNRINLYPFLLHVIVTLTPDILCRSSQEKPTFFIFLLMLLLSLNPHKKQMEQSNYSPPKNVDLLDQISNSIFDIVKQQDGTVHPMIFFKKLATHGILQDDPRIKQCVE